jgi:hypothetical protein
VSHDILAFIMSSSVIGELQARQAVQRLRQLRGEIETFAAHATLLASSKSFDPRLVLAEADKLLRSLMKSQSEFQKIKALTVTLSRSLPSRPPAGGGMAPAAKWGNEFRAGSKQFIEGVGRAEKAIQKLYIKAQAQINLPTRTATSPDGWFDAFLVLIDVLTQVVEYCKRPKK